MTQNVFMQFNPSWKCMQIAKEIVKEKRASLTNPTINLNLGLLRSARSAYRHSNFYCSHAIQMFLFCFPEKSFFEGQFIGHLLMTHFDDDEAFIGSVIVFRSSPLALVLFTYQHSRKTEKIK